MGMGRVVRNEVGAVGFTVIVPVVVDDDRRAVIADEAPAERLGEERRDEHFVRTTVGEHAPGHQHHPVGTPGLGEMVRGEDDHGALDGVLFDHMQDAELTGKIEPGDRLVEQEDVGIGRHRLRHQHPLLLAARQIAERTATQVTDLEEFGGGVDALSIGGAQPAQQAPVGEPSHPQHLLDRQRHPPVVVVVLGDHRDGAVDGESTVVRANEAGEKRQQRGLAAAVGPDERHRGAGAQLERRRCECHRGAVVHADVVGHGTRSGGSIGAGVEDLIRSGCHENCSHSSITRMILTRIGVVALATVSILTACSEAGTTDTPVDGPTGVSVLATTSIWADVASNVLCDEPVDAIIPVGADPHTFEPSLRDREALGAADLVIANGSGLEGSVIDLLDAVAVEGVNVVEMTTHIDVITTDEDDHDDTAEHDDETADDGHGHAHVGDADPHVWQDPTRIVGALDVIASAGTAIGLDDCSIEYAAELTDLDAEITGLLADIPPTRRIMVTSHDALAYFADRYDLEVIGTVIPSTNTLAQTNAAALAELADLIEARGVPAIFTEELESTADADALAERLGVAVVPLVTDALTDDGDTYIGMMRSNATKIAEALTP